MADVELVKKSLVRKPTADGASLDYGKLPPQAKELEEAVLAAVLIEAGAIHDVVEIIKTEDVFYLDSHQRIWRAIKALHLSHSPIDLLTVTEQLKKHGELDAAGGAFYVAQLTNKVGSAANVEYHARVLAEKWVARKLITISTEILKSAYEDTTDIFELVDSAGSLIDAVNLDISGQGQKSFFDSVMETAKQMRHAFDTHEYITGTPTFSPVLDRALLGLQKGNLIVVAGRPGMGKTTVAWHIALNQAKQGIPVGFFSLEMSDRELIHKMISADISVVTDKVRKGDMELDQWIRFDNRIGNMAGLPIQMNDRAGLTINQIISIAKNWVRKHKVEVIYIDYIGKIRTNEGKKYGTREQEVSFISGALKDFAKQMNIPVVVLSQLSRAVEQRGGDKRPILSDLRESGAVEQDADVVIFCYRPEYYGLESDSDGQRYERGYTELDIQKYRHGQPGMVPWIFEAKYSRFYDQGGSPEPVQQAQSTFRPLTEEEKPNKNSSGSNETSTNTPDDDLPF